MDHSQGDAIAIVGLAAQFPGASDAKEFWTLLEEGRDGVSEIPQDRWDAGSFYHPDPDTPGKMWTRRAGFIRDVSLFDAPFFGISPREAMFMDPQHRLMLETTWHALEDAAIAPSSLAGTRSGVFLGLSTHEYLGLLIRYTSCEDIDIYYGTGTSPAAAAGRISYRLGLEGPAVTVDTACSSSLVAIHQAAQALRSGECDLVIVGGVNVILTPAFLINLTRARMVAPDGRCKTFDAAADGYVRGEGCGVVIVKRLRDAIRDGDRIRAVMRGSAVNQDGASGGLTVPNGSAQRRVIAEALRQAGIEPGAVDYLEAHGTGTSLGDPIEVQAAAAAFGSGRDKDHPLWIGSVKTNIGHLEAAAGIAGVIKVVLAIEHGVLPQHLHLRTPSPHIPWDRLPVEVVRDRREWPRNGHRRTAGVSSFGFSGTNAHVLLEEAPVGTMVPSEAAPARRYHLLTLSARTPQALRELVTQYKAWLESHPEADLGDLCYTAGVGRSHLEHRAAMLVYSCDRARDLLSALAEERPMPGLFTGIAVQPPKSAWLFTGQGSQYVGMGQELFDTQPVFRQALEYCQEVLRGELEKPLLEVMFDNEELIGHTSYAQPAIFALEVGLARLWRHWGLEPDVVLGHSVGEYAAACVAGVFSLEDGLRLMARRGRLFGGLPAGGHMAAVFAEVRAVEEGIGEYPRLSVAGYNGAHTVVSGPGADVGAVAEAFRRKGVRCELLDTSHAFHSALLDPVLDEFEAYAQGIEYQPADRTLISNRTGKPLGQTIPDAGYWRRHARQPVEFAKSVETLSQLGCKILLEVGPHGVLTPTALRVWPEGREAPHAVSSLKKDASDNRQMVDTLAQLYVAGSLPDFRNFDSAWKRRKLDLPAYPFERKRHWYSSDGNSLAAESGGTVKRVRIPIPAEAPALIAPGGDAWLANIDPAERQSRLTEFIRAELARVLRAEPEKIDPSAPLVTLGVDSLTAMELRSRLQAALSAAIPAPVLFTNPDIHSLSRALVDLWLEARANPARRFPPIQRILREGSLPLSYAQEQLWFLHQLVPSSSAYNVAVAVRIRGSLDPAILTQAFQAVVARHEALRTAFQSEMGVPRADPVDSLLVDLPRHQVKDESEVAAWGARDASAPFDITTRPLFRARLLRIDASHHVLLLTMHHLVTDAWSFGVLLRDLGQLYRALAKGDASPLPELPIQYADFAAWQKQHLQGEALGTMLDAWKRDLEGAPPLQLSTDRPRPSTPTFRGARVRFELGRARAQAIHALCSEENVTLFAPLMAAFAVVLHRYSGQDDFIIGTLTANRNRLEIENLVGFFVNALPVRVRLNDDPDVRDLANRMRDRLLDVMTRQDVPFEMIVNAAGQRREAGGQPLFQVQLVLQGAPRVDVGGLGIEVTEIDTRTAKRDLTLTLFDDETLSGHVEYATDLFDAARMEQLIRHFEIVLDAMGRDRGAHLSALPLLTESEHALYAKRDCPRPTDARSAGEIFEATVDRTPDAIAVTSGRRALSYRELDQAANRVANWLRKRGVGPNTAIALRVDRSYAMPIGFLGILKAGGIYVPIDPAYPKDRIDYMLADAGVLLELENVESAEILAESPERSGPVAAPEDLAYIIYTSGSTGKPKGVKVTHGSVVEYAGTLSRELGIEPTDVYLHTASISFSSSIRQFVVPFAAGATLAIASADERRDPIALLRRIRESRVSVADLVPTMVRQVVDAFAALPAQVKAELLDNRLRLLLTASEALRFQLVQDWRTHLGAGARWMNMYGQTETTGIVSLYPVPQTTAYDGRIVSIGRPRGNVAMLVLDRQLRPVPCGITGDLYIAGEALAQGYTGASSLTAERFFAAPWDSSLRLYASGDLARLGWDGAIEFLGRADQQAKIRGLRVEPSEIERVLLEHPGVREAAVRVWDDGPDARIAAYYTCTGATVTAGRLRAHAHQKLPEHMVPSSFVPLEELPLTPTGKLDRGLLPRPEPVRTEEVEYLPPRAGVEETLARIWRDALRVDRVGAGDNFFALGGHSLLAVQVQSRIRNAFGVNLALAALFEDQTLSALALRIQAGAAADWKHALPPLVAVKRTAAMPVSYLQEAIGHREQIEPGSPGHWIDVGLRVGGPLDPDLLVRSVQSAIERHELLRTVFRPSREGLSQVVLGSHTLDVPVLDAPASTASERPFDLTAAPPLRAEILRTGPGDHTLRLRIHRILGDGLSTRLLLGEIGALYINALGDGDLPLLDSAIQYADYASWERTWLTGKALEKQIEFFRGALAPHDSAFLIPTDRPYPVARSRRGCRIAFELPPEVSATVHSLAAREQASIYMVLLAAFASAIRKATGRQTVIIGSPVSRRSESATQQMLGQFMNTLPLAIGLDRGEGFPGLVRHVKEVLLAALAHQDAPLERVIAALTAICGAPAAGIGEVSFVMADPPPRELTFGDLTLTRVETTHIVARRELTMSVANTDGDIAGSVIYDADLFAAETIQGIVNDFEAALAATCAHHA